MYYLVLYSIQKCASDIHLSKCSNVSDLPDIIPTLTNQNQRHFPPSQKQK